jgi:hypothetical protein
MAGGNPQNSGMDRPGEPFMGIPGNPRGDTRTGQWGGGVFNPRTPPQKLQTVQSRGRQSERVVALGIVFSPGRKSGGTKINMKT